MSAIRCTVVSPERPLFEGGADRVVAQGTRGQIAVLPRHAPLIAKLDAGLIRIVRAEGEERYAVSGGFLQVKQDTVTLLVTDAVRAEDIDPARLETELREVLETLRHPPSDEEYQRLLLRRRALRAQQKVLGKR